MHIHNRYAEECKIPTTHIHQMQACKYKT